MLPGRLDDLTRTDIESLVTDAVRESKALDFKRDAVGGRDDDKREFLADVSAFANTVGGDLVFGVEEEQGVAAAVPGLVLEDPDAEILRLEQIIRSGLEPRLPGVEIRWLPFEGASGVLLVRVRRSWAAPHRVTFRGDSRFYGRSSAGKFPLDVAELRTAFLAAEEVPERIRAFRRERCSVIESGDGAMQTGEGAQLVVHVVPTSAFGTTSIPVAFGLDNLPPPLGARGHNFASALEGHVTYSGNEDAIGPVRAYGLAFRDGRIEAVATVGNAEGEPRLPLSGLEQTLIDFLPRYFEGVRRAGLQFPFVVMVSLLGVRGYSPYIRNEWATAQPRPLRRDVVLLPEILLEDAPVSWIATLRPTLDQLWNAFGLMGSPNFDGRGNYIRR